MLTSLPKIGSKPSSRSSRSQLWEGETLISAHFQVCRPPIIFLPTSNKSNLADVASSIFRVLFCPRHLRLKFHVSNLHLHFHRTFGQHWLLAWRWLYFFGPGHRTLAKPQKSRLVHRVFLNQASQKRLDMHLSPGV